MKNLLLYKYLIAIFTFVSILPISTTEVSAKSRLVVTRNEHETAQLIERAKQLYQQEKYVEAIQFWQQAIDFFQQHKDILNQAMALSNLALTQQKLGDLTAAEEAIASSLKLLQTQSINKSQQRILANSLEIKGNIKRSQGQSKKAFITWQQAEEIYRQLENNKAVVNTQINQAQALQDLGYYRRASKILQSAQTLLVNEPSSPQKFTALLSFGDTLRATGNIEQSQIVLQETSEIAEELKIDRRAIFLSYGNTLVALGNRANESQAIEAVSLATDNSEFSCLANTNLGDATTYYLQAADCYQQAALSSNLATKVKAQLNLLSLTVQRKELEIIPKATAIEDLISTIKTNLAQLPTTRTSIYDRLNLVQSLICMQPNTIKFASPIAQQCQASSQLDGLISWSEIEQEVKIALQQAEELLDNPMHKLVLGYLAILRLVGGRFSPLALFLTKILSHLIETMLDIVEQWGKQI
ncbi:MAG: hypothetical protein AAF652_07280 [Cyanobacteria bacterium P01_C01_bin.72]